MHRAPVTLVNPTPYQKRKARNAEIDKKHWVGNAMRAAVQRGEIASYSASIRASNASIIAMGGTVPPTSPSDAAQAALEAEFLSQIAIRTGGQAFILMVPFGQEGTPHYIALQNLLEDREWCGLLSEPATDIAVWFTDPTDAVNFKLGWPDWFAT